MTDAQTRGFEAEYRALLLAHEDNVIAVRCGAKTLGLDDAERARALRAIEDQFTTAWLLLRIEWGME